MHRLLHLLLHVLRHFPLPPVGLCSKPCPPSPPLSLPLSLCRPCPASPWLPTPLPCHAVQPDYTVVPRESETYDIYLVPPGEDPETCQSWLRMRYRDGRYNLMFEEWVVEVRGRCRLWLCSFWPL